MIGTGAFELPDREVTVRGNRYDTRGDRPVEVGLHHGNQSQTFQLSRNEAVVMRNKLDEWLRAHK